jgi:hypothetical protein
MMPRSVLSNTSDAISTRRNCRLRWALYATARIPGIALASGPKGAVVGKQCNAIADGHRLFGPIQGPGTLQPPLPGHLRKQSKGLPGWPFCASVVRQGAR